MNSTQTQQRTLWGRGAGLAAAAVMILGLALAQGQPATQQSETAKTQTRKVEQKKAKPQLSGEELYQINCNRCHAERYPTEFTPGQWKTIMLEMRVRANLPAKQARKILKFLQADSGS